MGLYFLSDLSIVEEEIDLKVLGHHCANAAEYHPMEKWSFVNLIIEDKAIVPTCTGTLCTYSVFRKKIMVHKLWSVIRRRPRLASPSLSHISMFYGDFAVFICKHCVFLNNTIVLCSFLNNTCYWNSKYILFVSVIFIQHCTRIPQNRRNSFGALFQQGDGLYACITEVSEVLQLDNKCHTQ